MKGKVIIIAIGIFFSTCIYNSIRYELYEIPSSSMLPTLQVGDIIVGDNFGQPQRFDIVVVHFKSQDDVFVFRLIGLPGDYITYIDNEICINSKCLGKHLLDSNKDGTIFAEGDLGNYNIQLLNVKGETAGIRSGVWEWDLKNDEYIVLGDNRDVANDSRYLGIINQDDIIGVVDLISFE